MPSSNAAPAIANMQNTLKEFERILSQISLSAGATVGADKSQSFTPDDDLQRLKSELNDAKSSTEFIEVFNNTFSLTDEFGAPQTLRVSRKFLRSDDARAADSKPDQTLPTDDQVRKDMERDIIVINGVQYVGAKEKVDGLRTPLGARILDESREGELDGDQVCIK